MKSLTKAARVNKAIEVILAELETQEKDIPTLPPYPVK